MSKWKLSEVNVPVHNRKIVPIVSDAAIAIPGVCEGKLVPVLIIDTTGRSDIDDMVKFHEYGLSGDVDFMWGNLEWKKEKDAKKISKLNLILVFKRLSETSFILELDVIKQGALIERIVRAECVYLQPGRVGDRFRDDLEKSKILAEIPDGGFAKAWNKIWHEALVKKYKKDGLNRASAIQAAEEAIKLIRNMHGFRAKNP